MIMTTVCVTTNDCDYCVWDNLVLELQGVRQLGVGTTGGRQVEVVTTAWVLNNRDFQQLIRKYCVCGL